MSPEETLPPATLGASAVAGIECPACGTQNTNDSKFCRHCGHLLRPILAAPHEAKKAAAADGAESDGEGNLTSPAEIDARRAHQLLDRALLLSEKGDLNAALLACRQAVALDHDYADGYALLGTLLERNGDLRGARGAYERVLEIAPDNELERDSLNRIKARLDKAPAFNFNSNDLFGDNDVLPSVGSEANGAAANLPLEDLSAIAPEREEHGIEARLPPTSASYRTETPASAKEQPTVAATPTSAPTTFDFDAAPEKAAPSISPLAAALDGELLSKVGPPVAPSSNSSATPPGQRAVPKIERRVAQRRRVNVPVGSERRSGADRRANASVAGSTFAPSMWPAATQPAGTGLFTPGVTTPAAVAPLDFSLDSTSTTRAPLWSQMLRGSSFYGRTLPLIVVGVLGLGFLSWARSQAVARDTTKIADAAVVDQTNPSSDTTFLPDQQTPNTNPGVNQPGVPAPAPNTNNAGFPITNATAVPTQAATNTNTPPRVAANPGGDGRAGGNGGGNSRPNTGTPSFPAQIPPAAVPPAPSPNTSAGGTRGNEGNSGGGSGSGSPIQLPPPQVPTSGGQQTRVRVGSLGSTPLMPTAPQERIRISQGSITTRPAPPPRTGTIASGSERAANQAAANGNQDRQINNLTNAINASGNDQGFLLQQRAMAFMDRGDYSRAVEDFQGAIGAYQDQINRGENVAAAQAGLRSARSGLNLALSRRG